MTDYDADHDGDQSADHDMWIYLWMYDTRHPLTRYIIGISALAIAGWILTKLLTT